GGDLPLLTGAEQARLAAWNATAAPCPDRDCIHGIQARVARAHPDAPAVEGEGTLLTHGELDRRANRLAHLLRARGVGVGSRVAICLDRVVEAPLGILAILKAGAAYVPLDPAYPRERLRHMLEDAEPRLVITRAGLADRLPDRAVGEPLLLEPGADPAPDRPETAPEFVQTPDTPAYVIFTSGSTGRPKGIELDHRGLVNLIHDSNRRFGVTQHSRVLQFAAFGFDVAVWETWMALNAGGTLVLNPGGDLFSLLHLPRFLRQRRITHALLPPSLLAVLPADDLPELQTVIAVGERCTNANVARWAPGRTFFNGYGPAEGTVTVAVHPTDAHAPPRVLGPPIGRPLDNVRLHVLDSRGRELPVGIPGEIAVGGLQVARGYLKRPELTRERFVPDPFGSDPAARLYRTGDRGRRLPDGQLEFLGRLDHQIKIRGFRVELGEIEAVLGRDPQVAGAVVTLRAGPVPALDAYVVTRGGADPDPRRLRELAARHLPDYMVPATVTVLARFPLTPNGKVDRDALPAPGSRGVAAPNGTPPAWLRRFLGGDAV
ncbi:MAG: amino acid adenylation domain-containing protein, partial [Magnetococcales bacterium]|nr:amino acid adenylation domain-containing protein [Magnetococcales bacterium]